MQGVIELVVTLVAALAVAVFAQLGIGPDSQPDPQPAERVVARSPQARPPMPPQHTEGCPEAATPPLNLV